MGLILGCCPSLQNTFVSKLYKTSPEKSFYKYDFNKHRSTSLPVRHEHLLSYTHMTRKLSECHCHLKTHKSHEISKMRGSSGIFSFRLI